jgi:hypothetical protein
MKFTRRLKIFGIYVGFARAKDHERNYFDLCFAYDWPRKRR